MVEGARLESVFRRKSNVGSNPTLSAIQELVNYSNPRAIMSVRQLTVGEGASDVAHKSAEELAFRNSLPVVKKHLQTGIRH